MKVLRLTGMSKITVRKAVQQDVDAVLQLMKALAEFEGYHEAFAVTRDNLIELIDNAHQQVGILVAIQHSQVVGILVYFYQPFTYDLTPWMVIKELYVASSARGVGAGEALFANAVSICKEVGGSKLKWEVLAKNTTAQLFYKRMGAVHDKDWHIMSYDCLST